MQSVTLFRKEVLDRRADRLPGDIGLDLPLSWHLIGFTLLAALIAAVAFLAMAPYARVETVSGSIVLDRGVAPVMPSRAGIVMAVDVSDGQTVRAGQALATIRSEENVAPGVTAPDEVIRAIAAQDAGLARQSSESVNATASGQSRIRAQIQGLASEIGSLMAQAGIQRDLVASATRELALVQDVAKSGYISRRDILLREETLLTRRQQLAQLEQGIAAKRADLAEAQRSANLLRAEAGAQAAGISSNRAALAERRAQAESSRGYLLTAPVDGMVTAVTARPGQRLADRQPLMMIVPKAAIPGAELYVPTSAAGFLAVGQPVRLAIDAFPYQRFGTVQGRIAAISAVAVARPDASGASAPVYLVSATLDQPWIVALGQKQRLLPGMALTARIVTRKQSLIEWLFQPLFAVRRR